jgi:hypothetical protein
MSFLVNMQYLETSVTDFREIRSEEMEFVKTLQLQLYWTKLTGTFHITNVIGQMKYFMFSIRKPLHNLTNGIYAVSNYWRTEDIEKIPTDQNCYAMELHHCT